MSGFGWAWDVVSQTEDRDEGDLRPYEVFNYDGQDVGLDYDDESDEFQEDLNGVEDIIGNGIDDNDDDDDFEYNDLNGFESDEYDEHMAANEDNVNDNVWGWVQLNVHVDFMILFCSLFFTLELRKHAFKGL